MNKKTTALLMAVLLSFSLSLRAREVTPASSGEMALEYAREAVTAAIVTGIQLALLENSVVLFHELSHGIVAKVLLGDPFQIYVGIPSGANLAKVKARWTLLPHFGLTGAGVFWDCGFCIAPASGWRDQAINIAGGLGTVAWHYAFFALYHFSRHAASPAGLAQVGESLGAPQGFFAEQNLANQRAIPYLSSQLINLWLYKEVVREVTYALLPTAVKFPDGAFGIDPSGDGSRFIASLGIAKGSRAMQNLGRLSYYTQTAYWPIASLFVIYQIYQAFPNIMAAEERYWQ